ncbi:hypothetical protein [Thiocapsa bogorovii]|uniref:hypothetical protein n=1 Tax=Thiocapsa bogorovii TaxID=521689 RepID=UPI001E4B2F17|nr:hypothetical protein [Thiocapsa bogorovii]UHD14334.1 hypothetical protein LT988_13575 [Thiocapsa bogorovii]
MSTLRASMAEHGFESNDDYDFQVRCLLKGAPNRIRTLSIQGDGERRKTAFATALAHALDTPHILYHDFSDEEPPRPEVILPPGTDEYGRKASPVDPLDDIVSQACALSEAESTVLILDQLQAADFREHIRVHRLIRDRRWLVRDAPYYANPRNLLLFLISEAPLYHSLQRESFRVWVGRVSERRVTLSPEELGLGVDAAPLLDALNDLFCAVDASPTRSEVARLLEDLISETQVRSALPCVVWLPFVIGDRRCRLSASDIGCSIGRGVKRLRDIINPPAPHATVAAHARRAGWSARCRPCARGPRRG